MGEDLREWANDLSGTEHILSPTDHLSLGFAVVFFLLNNLFSVICEKFVSAGFALRYFGVVYSCHSHGKT